MKILLIAMMIIIIGVAVRFAKSMQKPSWMMIWNALEMISLLYILIWCKNFY